MTSKEAKAISEECKVECKKSVMISKLVDASCLIDDRVDRVKRLTVISIILSIISIILHFV